MKKLIVACCWALGASLSLTAQTPESVPVYLDDSQPIEARVQDALGRMTVAEKVAMCHAQSMFSIPGVPRLGIPEVWMSDGPHGVRYEISWNSWKSAAWTNDSCTAFPTLTCLAATWNPGLSREYGRAIGEEARYRRKDILLGPGVNIYRTPMNGRNFEYMGEDPYLAAEMVVPYIQGVQQNGVATSVKHFALNNQELWRGHIDVDLSDRALYEIYLPAFKAAVERGHAWTIMGAYNKFRGQHCCHNDLLLNKILKGEWRYDGCVVTDWGGAHDTFEAAMNGLDIEMGSYTNGLTKKENLPYDDYYLGKRFREGVESGKIPMSVLDDKAARVLRLTFRTAMNRQRPWGALVNDDHYRVAKAVAAEGIVLLKNDPVKRKEEALLPLVPERYGKILVIGDNAIRSLTKGGGSSELKVREEVSPLQALRARYGDRIEFTQGYAAGKPSYGKVHPVRKAVTDSLRRVALAKASEADLILFIGGLNKNHQQDCEAGDRVTYKLPFGQDALIADLLEVNPRVVLVLLSGNAVEMPWVKQVPSIVQGWFLGSKAGESLVEVLSGEINPSGKLPFSFPVKLEDNGAHAMGEMSYPGDSIRQYYKEDILVGYRWHDTKEIPALFPFGHGLSYTRFEYGKAAISGKVMTASDSLTVSIPVKNVGKVGGKEVVQFYIGDDRASVLRPAKELKGFAKIELAPGEEQTVTFTVRPDALKFFDEKAHDWVVEPGDFTVYVGSSSRDIKGQVRFSYQ